MLRCSPENLCKFLYHFVHKSTAIFKLIQGNRCLLFFCCSFSQVKCKRSKNVLEHAVPVVECLLIVSMVSGRSSVLSEDETAVRKFSHKHTVLSLCSSLTTCVMFHRIYIIFHECVCFPRWGACLKCSGERKRFRHILVYPAQGGRECAPADVEEVGSCPNPCAEDVLGNAYTTQFVRKTAITKTSAEWFQKKQSRNKVQHQSLITKKNPTYTICYKL